MWEVFPEVTEALEDLVLMQQDMSEATMALLERFVMLLYDRTSDIMNLNDARKQLFTQKSRSLENLPPSQEALKQHIKSACFQSLEQSITYQTSASKSSRLGLETGCNRVLATVDNFP